MSTEECGLLTIVRPICASGTTCRRSCFLTSPQLKPSRKRLRNDEYFLRSHPLSEPCRYDRDLLRPRAVLIPILLLHSLRHLGLMFLTRGATYPGLPSQFAYPAALGDVVTAALALIALFLVTGDSRAARPFVWLFNIFGTVDLAVAITLATVHNASPFMGPAYWIPALPK